MQIIFCENFVLNSHFIFFQDLISLFLKTGKNRIEAFESLSSNHLRWYFEIKELVNTIIIIDKIMGQLACKYRH